MRRISQKPAGPNVQSCRGGITCRDVPRWRGRVRQGGFAVLLIALGASATACRTPSSKSPTAHASASTPSLAASPSTAAPVLTETLGASTGAGSVADQLTVFFAEAERMDTQLRHAAMLINAGFLKETIRLDKTTVDAVRAIKPTTLIHRIPGGLDRSQLRAVLVVYGDLVSRRAAMNRVIEYAGEAPLPRDGRQARDLLACLANGAPAAATFSKDLAAAKATASFGSPTVATATSRSAAEAAIRATHIHLSNNGCGDCGGNVPRDLVPLTWAPNIPQQAKHFEGAVGGIRFRAQFDPKKGWAVELNAC